MGRELARDASSGEGVEPTADVLVMGGGPAGAAAAIALRQRGLAVIVVERPPRSSGQVGDHLGPSVLPLLARLGVLDRVASGGHRRSVGVRSAWGERALRDRDYVFSPEGAGFHLDREPFDAMLLAAAEEAGAHVVRGAASVARHGESFRALVERDRRRTPACGAVLVDATGRAASFARALGASRRVHDRLVGVTAFLAPRPPVTLEDAPWIEAIEGGWWYSAPLSADRLAITFFTDAERLAGGAVEEIASTALARSEHTRARVAPFEPPASWVVRPAGSESLDRAAGPGWVAVGDAATARDPLSSSGIAHALEDGLDAALAIAAHLAGDGGALAQYGAARLRAFDAYLEERARYYRMEKRFPASPFWQRRRGLPGAAPITLDPRAPLRVAAHGFARARRAAADLPPGVDPRVLLDACADPTAAHVLVAAHRRAYPNGASDHDVILAVQALLDRGALEVVGAPR